MRKFVLHIGTHRTGTTSIQRALSDHRRLLADRFEYNFPVGMFLPDNHVELVHGSLRPDRIELFPPLNTVLENLGAPSDDPMDAGSLDLMRPKIRDHVAATDGRSLIYSSEGLSFLRYPDELDRLLWVLDSDDVSMIMFTREPRDFLASYEASLRSTWRTPSDNPRSHEYVEPDSWLIDYDSRRQLWSSALGDDAVTVVDYEGCVARNGSVVPAFFEMLGIPPTAQMELGRYHLNRR